MDNYDVMAGSCPNCVAADKEIEALQTRFTAADALFKASKDAAKFVAKYVADAENSTLGQRALDRLEKAMREYEEVANPPLNQQEEIELREGDTLQVNSTLFNHPCWCGRRVCHEIRTPRESKYLCAGCAYALMNRAKVQGIPCKFGVQYQVADND